MTPLYWGLILFGAIAALATGYFVYTRFFEGIHNCAECKKAGGVCKYLTTGSKATYNGCTLPTVPTLPSN